MDLDQISGFLCVAEQKNVTTAAKQLNISQSALSRQISSLERGLGCSLFLRAGGGMRLSPFGELFLPDARRIADDVDQAISKLQGSADQNGILRIGHVPILMSAFIADTLLSYSMQYPEVRIEMTEVPLAKQIALLRAGSLDVVCADTVHPPDLLFDRIAKVPLLEISSLRGGPKKSIDADGLTNYRDRTFIIPDRKDYPNAERIVRQVCRRAGYEPKLIELSGISTVLMAIALGRGAAILPAHFCLIPNPGLRYEALPFVVPEADIIALTRRQSRPKSVQRFISLLKQQAGLRYQCKFWKVGHEAQQLAFSGSDRRKSVRRGRR